MTTSTPKKSNGFLKWLLPVVILLSVASGLSYVAFFRKAVVEKDKLNKTEMYLITVSSIEVSKTTAEGKAWDIDGSGPDLFFEIYWQQNLVFKSSTKTDTLIGVWESQELDLMNIVQTRRIEAKNNGALVKPGSDSELVIKVYDSDTVRSDLIEEFKLNINSLKPGKNELGPGPLKQCLKLVVQVIPVPNE